MSWIITPTISYLGLRVAGQEPIFNSPINTNSISWKIQQSTTFILVIGLIVAGLRPIYTSLFNINSCLLILRWILAGLLWPRSTYINISFMIMRKRVAGQSWPTSTTSEITRGEVAGILIPISTTFVPSSINWLIVSGFKRTMSTTFLSRRHFHTFFFRTFITVIKLMGGRMAGLTRPIS